VIPWTLLLNSPRNNVSCTNDSHLVVLDAAWCNWVVRASGWWYCLHLQGEWTWITHLNETARTKEVQYDAQLTWLYLKAHKIIFWSKLWAVTGMPSDESGVFQVGIVLYIWSYRYRGSKHHSRLNSKFQNDNTMRHLHFLMTSDQIIVYES